MASSLSLVLVPEDVVTGTFDGGGIALGPLGGTLICLDSPIGFVAVVVFTGFEMSPLFCNWFLVFFANCLGSVEAFER